MQKQGPRSYAIFLLFTLATEVYDKHGFLDVERKTCLNISYFPASWPNTAKHNRANGICEQDTRELNWDFVYSFQSIRNGEKNERRGSPFILLLFHASWCNLRNWSLIKKLKSVQRFSYFPVWAVVLKANYRSRQTAWSVTNIDCLLAPNKNFLKGSSLLKLACKL